jgi:hypothetical protein
MVQGFQANVALRASRHSRSMTFESARILLLMLTCGVAVAHSDPVYGVISSGDIASGNGPSTFPTQQWNFGHGVYQPVIGYTSPVLSASGSYTGGTSTVSGSATSWASSNGASLHGYATASLSGLCMTCAFTTENGGGFALQWTDTLLLGGLPIGTPIDLMFTDVLHSSTSISGNGTTELQSDGVLGSQEIDLFNDQGAANGVIARSVLVSTVSGASLHLTAALIGNLSVAATGDAESATIDASDTANAYIAILTPGASYTTASGLDYASPSAVPEPNLLWLEGIALTGLWLGTRRRFKGRS